MEQYLNYFHQNYLFFLLRNVRNIPHIRNYRNIIAVSYQLLRSKLIAERTDSQLHYKKTQFTVH